MLDLQTFTFFSFFCVCCCVFVNIFSSLLKYILFVHAPLVSSLVAVIEMWPQRRVTHSSHIRFMCYMYA